jgi:hypothetical protein
VTESALRSTLSTWMRGAERAGVDRGGGHRLGDEILRALGDGGEDGAHGLRDQGAAPMKLNSPIRPPRELAANASIRDATGAIVCVHRGCIGGPPFGRLDRSATASPW